MADVRVVIARVQVAENLCGGFDGIIAALKNTNQSGFSGAAYICSSARTTASMTVNEPQPVLMCGRTNETFFAKRSVSSAHWSKL